MAEKTKKTENPRAILLRGDDDFQKQQALDKLLKSLVADDFADFDLEQLEGNNATSDRIMSGLNVPPFASKQRVVLVRYANKMNEDEQKKLASLLEKVPTSGCLIMTNPAAEKVDGRAKKGSEVIGDLSKAMRKIGEVHEFGNETNKIKGERAREFAQSLFIKAGKKLDSAAMAAFIQRAGSDFAVLSTEAQKLIDYSGDSERITSQDVALVTSEAPEEKIFKLVDSISARNRSAALKLLDELFAIGDDPKADAPKTLATIARHFRLIWQARFLAERRVTTFRKDAVSEEIKSALPSDPNILDVVGRQSWQADKFSKQAKAFTQKDLIGCFSAIARADLRLKGIEGNIEDSRLVMELLIFELAKDGQRGR